jgi:hypothetical protein
MITSEDMIRLHLPKLTSNQIRRLLNAENACRNSSSNWSKEYWFNVFQKLCEKYDVMDYFRKVLH